MVLGQCTLPPDPACKTNANCVGMRVTVSQLHHVSLTGILMTKKTNRFLNIKQCVMFLYDDCQRQVPEVQVLQHNVRKDLTGYPFLDEPQLGILQKDTAPRRQTNNPLP